MVKMIKSMQEFDDELKNAGCKLVIVDFTATWCGPCRMIAPLFEELSKKHSGVIFLKVDVDESEDISQKYGITAMPTFIFIKNGEKVDVCTGADIKAVEKKLNAHM
ncbi:thioredoxin-like [Lissotriton helveticus]